MDGYVACIERMVAGYEEPMTILSHEFDKLNASWVMHCITLYISLHHFVFIELIQGCDLLSM